MWTDGKHTKGVYHLRSLHRPANILPWPLSLVQPHQVELRIYEGNFVFNAEPIYQQLYKKAEIPKVIEEFLRGSIPNTLVSFS